MSNVSGSVHACWSRLAEPPTRNTGLRAGMVTPCSVTSRNEHRTLYCEGASYRSSSSTASGILLRSSSNFCHWPGFWANTTAALPSNLVTVSAPAPPSNTANWVISALFSWCQLTVVAFELGLDQLAQQIVTQIVAALLDQLVVVDGHVEHRTSGHFSLISTWPDSRCS